MNTIQTVRARCEALLWDGNLSENAVRMMKECENAQALYDALCAGDIAGTWCWSDIDYTDQTRADWKCAKHYVRLLFLLRAFGRERLQSDRVFAERMVGALQYWLAHDFSNPNWWHNEIGVPRNIADTALMLYPLLDRQTLDRAAEVVGRGSKALRSDFAANWAGANLIWCVANSVRHALLTEDEALLGMAAKRAEQELIVGQIEGIQTDGSFFQHGPRLYSGGYGRSFTYDMAQLAYILQQTPYQFSCEKLEIFQMHVLDGLRHMTQGDGLDYACVGREIVRADAVKVGILKSAVALMAQTADLPRGEQTREYLRMINGEPSPDTTKYFPIAAMLCHHTGGIYIGAKFMNDKIHGAELCNGEGELCYNMSYGTHTCVMRDGGEYHNIDAVWDYSRVPGTTSRTETDEELRAHRDWWISHLPSAHSGGLQKDRRALIYESADHDGIRAFVSHFAFEGGFVCMGSGISDASGREEALVTTVDQCFLRGEVTEDDRSILHNGIRYTPLGDSSIEWKSEVRQGAWNRNNTSAEARSVTASVLTLTVPHESGVVGAYAYMISPADRPLPCVKMLANTPAVQAILLPDGGVMAVFHEDGKLTLTDRVIEGKKGGYIES